MGIDIRLWNETGVGRYTRNLVKFLLSIDQVNEYVLFAKSNDLFDIHSLLGEETNKWKIVKTDIHWHSLKEQLYFPKILNNENLDLMHFPYFSIPVMYSRRFVVTIHDLIIYHYPTGKASTLPLPLYKFKHFGYQQVVRQAVKKASKIIVPLNSTKDDLSNTLKIDNEKIEVTYEGVDDKIYNPKQFKVSVTNSQFNSLQSKFFLYVGNAYPHKNIETMLMAFIKLKQDGKAQNVKMILVGKEDYFYKRLKENLAVNNIDDIEILHKVDDAYLHYLYRHALAVVTPSYIEGFGLVPLEAMANECLVLASDIPAHQEVCGKAAVYFDPNKAKDLLEKLQKILNIDATEKQTLLELGLENSKKFSWKKMAEETLAIYNSILNR